MTDKPKFQGKPAGSSEPEIRDALLFLFDKFKIVEANGFFIDADGFWYKFTYPDNSFNERNKTIEQNNETSQHPYG